MRRAFLYPNPVRSLARLLLTALVVVVASLSLGGCSLQDVYVAADRATFDAIAPDYRARIAADKSLTPEQRKRRDRAVDSWEGRLVEGEGGPK